MSNLQANRTLSGSFAEVWVDGARIAELSQLTLTIKVQREKVQFGMDVDSKITGYAGEGTMTLKQVYTRFYEVLEQAKRGLDKRCTSRSCPLPSGPPIWCAWTASGPLTDGAGGRPAGACLPQGPHR